MRLDLTPDEVELLIMLVTSMDDCEDDKTKRVADNIERYLRRRLKQERERKR